MCIGDMQIIVIGEGRQWVVVVDVGKSLQFEFQLPAFADALAGLDAKAAALIIGVDNAFTYTHLSPPQSTLVTDIAVAVLV